jgi:ubiquitin C-terminal hydrolase
MVQKYFKIRESRQVFQQRDVIELFQVLFEAVDKYLTNNGKNKEVQGISELYRGKIKEYIKTDSTTYEGKEISFNKLVDFTDIQLVVRDIDDLMSSLEFYLKPEYMRDDSKWKVEVSEGNEIYVDAIKGMEIVEMPYILTFQLNRFDYDPKTYERVKLSSKFTYPFELKTNFDLEKNYELFSVMIHSGTPKN